MTFQEQLAKEQLDLYLLTHGLPKSQRTPPPQPNFARSTAFYASIGYPQFGGKYEPFNIPRGTKIKAIRETSEGLDISYVFNQPSKAFLQKRDPLSGKEPQHQTSYGLQPEPPAKSGYYYDPTGQFYKSVGYNLGEAILALKGERPQAKEPTDWQKRGFYPSSPESRYIHSETAPTTLGAEPETYESWIPQGRPESRYLIRNELPTIADVTLVKTPPSVRVEVLNRIFQEQLGKPLGVQGAVSFEDMLGKLSDIHTRLGATQESLTILQYKMKGYEFLGRTDTELLFKKPDIFVPYSGSVGMSWVKEETGERFIRVGEEWIKMELGSSPSPEEYSAMLQLSLVNVLALPVNIPKLAVFAVAGIGVGETAKYGLTGQHLTVEEIIGAASVGELVGLVGMSVGKTIQAKVQPRASKWLTEQYREGFTGGFAKEQFGFEAEFGFQKGAEAIDIPVSQWKGWSERIVMRLTGARPYIAGGEISIPVMEAVSKTGVISGVPKGLAFTDIGWELSVSPRMGGVMLTKWPTVTTPKALELFFGIGEELIPFSLIKSEGETLGFEKTILKRYDKGWEPIEKGLPPSMLDESYYPKVGFLDAPLKDVNVRGATSWTKWPSTRSLMEEQKLLPFVTQTQLTRMGIFPYVPDMNVGLAASKSLGPALLATMGFSLLPMSRSQPRQGLLAIPRLTTMPKLEPAIKLKLPSFEEPFEIQRLKMFPQFYPSQKQRKRAALALTPMVSLEPLTETLSVSALRLDVPQLTEQVQKQRQSLAMPTFSLPKQALSFPTFSKIPSIREPSFKGLGGGLFGKWFQRSHAIPTEKQIMRELGFSTGRKKGRTGKRRYKQHKRAKR